MALRRPPCTASPHFSLLLRTGEFQLQMRCLSGSTKYLSKSYVAARASMASAARARRAPSLVQLCYFILVRMLQSYMSACGLMCHEHDCMSMNYGPLP
eukprot:6201985-Pleurochrysis_carterae.AAC.6